MNRVYENSILILIITYCIIHFMQLFKDNRAVYKQKETGHATHQDICANVIDYISLGKFSVLYFRL